MTPDHPEEPEDQPAKTPGAGEQPTEDSPGKPDEQDDDVDELSEESFPASDPPGNY